MDYIAKPIQKFERPSNSYLRQVDMSVISNYTKFVIVLPCYGSPYVIGHFNKNDTNASLKLLQKAVGGPIESFPNSDFIIHPMFAKDNQRWKYADTFLSSDRRTTKVYVNAEGSICGPNMATIKRADSSGCPHLLGDVALVVSGVGVLRTLGLSTSFPDSMTLVKNPDSNDDIWEFDTDEDIEKFKKDCEEKGWDYYEETGQVYKCKMPGV